MFSFLRSLLLWLLRPLVDLFSSFLSVLLAVDENDTHASAYTSTTTTTATSTTTTATIITSAITTTTTTTATSTTTTTTITTITTFNTTVTNRAKAKLKFPKSTLNRLQPLYSQRIVIGWEELAGRNIEHVVRQRINALINKRSPKVIRSTALIIKSSKTSANINGCPMKNSTNLLTLPDPQSCHNILVRDAYYDKTSIQVSDINNDINHGLMMMKTANGCVNLTVRPKLSNGFNQPQRWEVNPTGKCGNLET